MSGNAADASVRLYPDLLKACSATPCEVCGGHLPDHDWADLDQAGTVVDCSELRINACHVDESGGLA